MGLDLTFEFIDSALERVMLGEVPNPEEVMARRRAGAQESAAAGRRLEMALTVLELSLETGVMVPGFGEAMRSDPDVQVQRLVDALTRQPKDEVEARARAATYAELRGPAGRKAHVLGTFEASARRLLREVDEARKLLVKDIRAWEERLAAEHPEYF